MVKSGHRCFQIIAVSFEIAIVICFITKKTCTESFPVDILLLISLRSCAIFDKDYQENVVNILPA